MIEVRLKVKTLQKEINYLKKLINQWSIALLRYCAGISDRKKEEV